MEAALHLARRRLVRVRYVFVTMDGQGTNASRRHTNCWHRIQTVNRVEIGWERCPLLNVQSNAMNSSYMLLMEIQIASVPQADALDLPTRSGAWRCTQRRRCHSPRSM